MYRYLIYEQLKSHARTDKSFHMPGHKARGDFKAKFAVAPLDVTELSYSGNLFCPSGVAVKAQEEIAEILGAKFSRILTGGSTSGVLAMVYALSGSGSKIIIPRNSHQSVWNACRLFNLEPVTVQGGDKDGVMLPPDPTEIEELLANDNTIAGMVALSPDYYGNVAPLKEYSEILKKYRRYLAVDGAHGAHLAFLPQNAGYAGVYADMWVDGAHKTLPVLTQGAVVSANCEELVPDLFAGLSLLGSTSPSFPVAASVEYGVKYLKNNPKVTADSLAAIEAFREKCPFKFYPSADKYKLALDCESFGADSDDVAALLEKKGIYAELSDGRYVLFYLSPMNTAADLNRLSAALNAVLNGKKLKKRYGKKPKLPPLQRTFSYLYAFRQKSAAVPLDKASGKMCAQNAGIAPPCIPVIAAGEIITDEALAILASAKNVYGLENGKIRVVVK